jgi:hypothetical protein
MNVFQRAGFHPGLGPLRLIVALGRRLPTVLAGRYLPRAPKLAPTARIAGMAHLGATGRLVRGAA